MMYNYRQMTICTIFLIFFNIGHVFARNLQLEYELDRCLINHWGIDPHTTMFIRHKLEPLLEKESYHHVIRDFIALSIKQKIDFSINKSIKPLHSDDGILKAPEQHLVIFESPYVRVLWGSTKPGISEASHTHAWKSIMLTIRPTKYQMEYQNGSKEILDCPRGAVELPAGEKYACKNIGNESDESLRFEIKD